MRGRTSSALAWCASCVHGGVKRCCTAHNGRRLIVTLLLLGSTPSASLLLDQRITERYQELVTDPYLVQTFTAGSPEAAARAAMDYDLRYQRLVDGAIVGSSDSLPTLPVVTIAGDVAPGVLAEDTSSLLKRLQPQTVTIDGAVNIVIPFMSAADQRDGYLVFSPVL